MKLLPGARFSIASPLSPDQVQARLAEAIGPRPSSVFDRGDRAFWGRVSEDSFDVVRAVQGRNSFRPRIRGTIEPVASGTRIHGTMRVPEVLLGCLALLALGPGLIFMNLLGGMLKAGGLDRTALTILTVVAGFLAVAVLVFVLECRQARRALSTIVEGA